ncbi:nudC domain-containing protein 3-like isoform X2 [Glandiceps talaboti]
MDASVEMYDSALLGILQHVGEIKPFLEVVFSFLLRRTDFFRIIQDKEGRMGFPPGVAKQLVMETVTRYEQIAKSIMEQSYEDKMTRGEIPPRAVETVEVDTRDDDTRNTSCDTSSQDKTQSLPEQKTTKSGVEKDKVKPKSAPYESGLPKVTSQKSDCYNGAIRDKYSWSQSFTDVDITVPVPKEVKRAKDIQVDIGKKHLKVSVKPGVIDKDAEILMEGKLTYDIRREESMWSLVPGVGIQINLEKNLEKMWLAVLEGEEEIKRDDIDPTRHLHEMDDDAQAGWRQAMFDFEQKKAGKPSSKELETHTILEKAWDAEGSPFKGTPFDPSKMNIST